MPSMLSIGEGVRGLPVADLIGKILDLVARHVRGMQGDDVDRASQGFGSAPNRSPL